MIKYFWIAEYKNGFALPQFDPNTGKENLFKEIDQSKLIRFGLYPFSFSMSEKVECGIPSLLPTKFIINLNDDDKLFFRRRNYIQLRGKDEYRHIEYIIGTQYYTLHIDELGNVEVNKK